MIGPLPIPIWAEANKRNSRGESCNIHFFYADFDAEKSALGLGADGQTYLGIPRPRRQTPYFNPPLITPSTIWTWYRRETIPEIYDFLGKEASIDNFCMALISPTKAAVMFTYA